MSPEEPLEAVGADSVHSPSKTTQYVACRQSGIEQLGTMQENGIVQLPIGQLTVDHQGFPFKLSWTHYQVLMIIEESAERSFYELEAIKGVWNVKTLKRQYHSKIF